MSIGDSTFCPNCNGVFPYHNLPCNGGVSSVGPTYEYTYPTPATLTEADVRRIVREELAAKHMNKPIPTHIETVREEATRRGISISEVRRQRTKP